MVKTLTVRIAIVLTTLLLAAGCAALSSPTSVTPKAAPPTPTTASNPSAGPKQPAASGAPLYMLNCSPCHGSQGQGIDAPPLANNAYIQNASDAALARTVNVGFPGTEMPAWLRTNGGPFTQEQVMQVVAYLRTMQPTAAGAAATPSAASSGKPAEGDAQAGKLVFGTYCAVCHGPQGVQGLPNPGSDDGAVPVLNPMDPEIVGSSTSAFSSNLQDILSNGSIAPGDQPLIVMPAFGKGHMLTDQQIADVIAYVIQLNSGN